MTEERNIVLVTVDSLRADHCGFNGSKYDLTPTLDDLAAEGIVFENAYAPGPRTPSSVPVLLTGAFPSDRAGSSAWQARWDRIRRHLSTHRTLAECLKQRGYTTVGITTNPWTHGNNFDTGFDQYVKLTADDMQSPSLGFRALEWGMQASRFGEQFDWGNAREWFTQWQNLYHRISEEVATARENDPYFVWIFLLDSHQPYVTPRDYRVESNVFEMYLGAFQETQGDHDSLTDRTMDRLGRSYRDSIRSTDAFVDRLYQELKDDDPVFVFHSDHGEAFGEHGTYGHKQQLYDENLHVPFFVHGIDCAERVESLIPLRTLPNITSRITETGRFDPHTFTRDFVYGTTESTDTWAIRTEHWKYILGENEYLFDLRNDSEEQENRFDQHPNIGKTLRRLLAKQQFNAKEKRQIGRAVAERSPLQTPVMEEKP